MAYEKYRKTSAGAALLTVDELRTYLKADEPSEELLIEGLINGWTAWAEEYCWSSFNETEFTLTLTEWQTVLTLRRNPIKLVDLITYYDQNNVQQTLATTEYDVLDDDVPAQIEFDSTPALYDRKDAITITFKCEALESIPIAKLGIQYLVALQYLQREDFKPDGPYISIAKRLLAPIRLNYFY